MSPGGIVKLIFHTKVLCLGAKLSHTLKYTHCLQNIIKFVYFCSKCTFQFQKSKSRDILMLFAWMQHHIIAYILLSLCKKSGKRYVCIQSHLLQKIANFSSCKYDFSYLTLSLIPSFSD